MLILARKSGESITIKPEEGAHIATSVGQFFQNQPIKVCVRNVDRGVAKLGISAHRALNIVRDELLPKPQSVQRDVLNNAHYGNARQSLAANLYTHRINRQWTLQDLALETGIPLNTLTAMEHGANRISLEDLEVIAEVFGVEVGGLFGK